MKITVLDSDITVIQKGDIIEFENSRNPDGKKSFYMITYLEKEKKYYLASLRGSQRKITLYDSIEEMLGNRGCTRYSGKTSVLNVIREED